jgi:hypothetical protein
MLTLCCPPHSVWPLITWHHILKVHPQACRSNPSSAPLRRTQSSAPKVRKSVSSRIHEAVKAIALCHNVTPVYEARAGVTAESEFAEADQDLSDENRTYQASSPDEVSHLPEGIHFRRLFSTVQTRVIHAFHLASTGIRIGLSGVRTKGLLVWE